MRAIDFQIKELRLLFNTKNIFDKCSKAKLTNDELMGIIEVIKKNKKDGFYEISDDIEIELTKGKVYITDNE